MLIISGLDPGGGAGFIADVRIASAHGLRGVGIITALTEQDSHGLYAANPAVPQVIAQQLERLLADVAIAAVKIGMLGNREIATVVAGHVADIGVPIVWDPVLVPSSGAERCYDSGVGELAAMFARSHCCLTPNIMEAEAIVGFPVRDVAQMRTAGRRNCDAGFGAALISGGHLVGDAVDVLQEAAGEPEELRAARIPGGDHVHGTGCALSTALACGLARGCTLLDAARQAKAFVTERIEHPTLVGRGKPAIL